MIIVKPNGGLGNRMRVINSALNLAKDNKEINIKVLWKRYEGMSAGFEDIFKPIPHTFISGNLLIMTWYFYSRKLPGLKYLYYDDASITKKAFEKNYWNIGHNKVILNTCLDFYELNDQTNFYHLFQPVEKLQARINEISGKFDAHTIGVHIRRTDNLPSKENSKTSDFIIRMKNIIEEKESSNFYVSTDDAATEHDLKMIFGDKIITMGTKDLKRNKKTGIEDAVVDMYCLSKTNLILGSYSSSFSTVASALGKIPLEIITSENK